MRPVLPVRREAPVTGPDCPPLPFGLSIETVEVGAETLVVFGFPLRGLARSLTRVERLTVALILEGLTTAEIAAARGVARTTVSSQLRSIYGKLSVSSRTELACKLG
jgi:DNA-binding CsgD family transcriptional regulator